MAKQRSNLIAIAILILALAFYLRNIDQWFMHDDEGSYAYASWRISQGDLPYRDFLTPQLPLFLYVGGAIVGAFGPSLLALRYATVLTTLLAAFFVYLAAKEVFGYKTALLCLPLFIIHRDVYFIARFFRPEAYMLLFAAMGMYVFTLCRRHNGHPWLIFLSGALYGLAMLCKLFAALPFAGCLLFVAYRWWRSADRCAIAEASLLVAGFAAVAGTTFIAFQLSIPHFLTAVLGHHLMQGGELDTLGVCIKGLRFYWRYLRGNRWLLLLTIPGIARTLRAKDKLGALFTCQIPTAAAFLFLSRSLQERHLVYLVPSLSVLCATSVQSLFSPAPAFTAPRSSPYVQRAQPRNRWVQPLLGILLMGLALWPSWQNDLQVASWWEEGTVPLAQYIQAHTLEDDYVLSDYPGLNFHAQRKNTYLGAGLSGGATSSGQIMGNALVREIEDNHVKMVLINTAGHAHQLVNLHDYAEFRQYVQSHFHFVRAFQRSYETIEIYYRDDLLPLVPDTNFGGKLALIGADLESGTAQAGLPLAVTLRWKVLDGMGRDYTVSLRLLDEKQHLAGQWDGLLLKRFTSHWEGGEEVIIEVATSLWDNGEVLIDEHELPVLAGSPPGEYRVAVLLYHLASGERLSIIGEGGLPLGTEYPLGTVRISKPDEPPTLDELAIQHLLPRDLELANELALLGYNRSAEKLRPGDTLTLTLFWRALRQMGHDWHLLLRIRDSQGRIGIERESALANVAYPTSQWEQGEITRAQHDIAIGSDWPSGGAQLTINLIDPATSQPLLARDLVLFDVEIAGVERQFDVPEAIQHYLEANLGNRVALLGYDLAQTSVTPGDVLHFTVYWRALSAMEASYTVFTHLLGEEGQIWGQKDGVPVRGTYPTTGWLPEEIIVDEYEVAVQPGAPLGEYVLEIGLYDAATGERLPVIGETGQTIGNRILLAEINVEPSSHQRL